MRPSYPDPATLRLSTPQQAALQAYADGKPPKQKVVTLHSLLCYGLIETPGDRDWVGDRTDFLAARITAAGRAWLDLHKPNAAA
jgi:hypothetical protein